MKKKVSMLVLAIVLMLGLTACDSSGSMPGGSDNNGRKNVCAICGGSGWQTQVLYYDMNNFPVYGQAVCGGCSGFGYY